MRPFAAYGSRIIYQHKLNQTQQMKTILNVLLLTAMVACSKATIDQNNYINPTGTYELESETRQEGDDTYGYTGQIQVKTLKANSIVMTFGINKGAPSYNAGSFVDTLDYRNNRSMYQRGSAIDSSCTITFDFTDKQVIVKEAAGNHSYSCGFGYGVVADGVFKKITSEEPLLQHPMTGEEIK